MLRSAALILFSGLLTGLSAHWVRNDGLELFGPTPVQEKTSEFQTVTLDEARILWESGMAAFVDARPREAFDKGHIPRAIYGHPDDEEASASLFVLLDPNQALVIYCAGGECKDTLHLAEKLKPLGFKRLKLFMGGWPEWEKAGLPQEPMANSK